MFLKGLSVVLGTALTISIYFNISFSKSVDASVEERRKLENEKIDLQTEVNELNNKAKKELIREMDLDNCLENARKAYNLNWESACKLQSETNKKLFKTCEEREYLFHDEYCEDIYDTKFNPECALVSAKSESVNESYKEQKDECFKRYK